jgi:hypothetical protein
MQSAQRTLLLFVTVDVRSIAEKNPSELVFDLRILACGKAVALHLTFAPCLLTGLDDLERHRRGILIAVKPDSGMVAVLSEMVALYL